ncbi:MAG: response regulator [Bacteroidota bacterium]
MINDIFLIDDDILVNFLNKEVIKNAYIGKNISAFDSATIALDTLKQISTNPNSKLPLLILLDINMPEMDGWEFLEEFNQLPKSVIEECKVVMHSSSIDPRDMEKAKTFSSVKDFISKPLTAESLTKFFYS